MNPLPPQAYTKETLTKAFAWLQDQNESIKELATTPDILVSLYLKAKLNGDAALERPSIQNFKTELKNLAGMIGEFDNRPVHQTAVQQAPPPQSQPVQQQASQNYVPTRAKLPDLDLRSYELLREIKGEFNLSDDNEALKLLISIGYKKLKNI